jgi:hypothetical protein
MQRAVTHLLPPKELGDTLQITATIVWVQWVRETLQGAELVVA